MNAFSLGEGLVIRDGDLILEYKSRAQSKVYFSCPETGEILEFEEADLIERIYFERSIKIVESFSSPKELKFKESDDNDRLISSLLELPEKYQTDIFIKKTYILELWKRKISRGKLGLIAEAIPQIKEEKGLGGYTPSAKTVSKWMKIYEESSADVYSLVNRNSCRIKRTSASGENESLISKAIDLNYATSTRNSKLHAYRRYIALASEVNLERSKAELQKIQAVSERTFCRRIDSCNQFELDKSRYGIQKAKSMHFVMKGHMQADFLLQFAEVDHSPLDMYIIDDIALLPLGRPYVTVIRERISGVVLGFYVSFHHGGLGSIFGALKHSLIPHISATEMWGFDNKWPCFGKASTYVTDRGGDFISLRYRTSINEIGSHFDYCERRTPWHKPGIERFFGTVGSTLLESLPGKTFSKLDKRHGYNPAKDAVVRFSSFVFLLHKWAIDEYHVTPNERKQASPIDIWNDLIVDSPPPLPIPTDNIDVALGHHHTGTLSNEGIRFSWLQYSGDILREIAEESRPGISLKFVVRDEDLGSILVLPPGRNRYVEIFNTRPDYANGLSLAQHQYLRKEAGVKLKASTAVDTLIATRNSFANILGEEIEKKKTREKERLARLAKINSESIYKGDRPTITKPFGEEVACKALNTAFEEDSKYKSQFTNVPVYDWRSS